MRNVISIDMAAGAPSVLPAIEFLRGIPKERCHHVERGLRLPLGIYNVSIARIASRVGSLCESLEDYLRLSVKVSELQHADRPRNSLVDCIELAFYAAAEHVDDVEAIAKGLLTDRVYDRNPAYKALQKSIKESKRFIAMATNVIKHQQARIRLFAVELAQAGHETCLHGFFIEGVDRGVVGPRHMFEKGQDGFAIPTLVWEIVVFVLEASLALRTFLQSVLGSALDTTTTQEAADAFKPAIIAAARLPIYTFGEAHPFDRLAFQFLGTPEDFAPLRSGLYGSYTSRWSMAFPPSFGHFQGFWEGDGVSVSFRMPVLNKVQLAKWD